MSRTGARMTAEEACAHGLVNRVVPADNLMEVAMKMARKLSEQAPLSLRLIKETVNQAADLALYEAMLIERKNFYLLFASEDQKEGMAAFREKRKPVFKGR